MPLTDISPAEAAKELLRRRRARVSLTAFSQSVSIPGAPMSEDPDNWLFHPIETSVARHHIVTMDAIQRCIEADSGRLMLFQPPGSAKSTYASVVAPAWAMGRLPGYKVILTSYAATPAERQSKRCRAIVASPEYRSIWPQPVGLMAGSTAVSEWQLTNDSGLLAAGILGAVTSARADLLIIDDPVAGREEADSETIRKKTLQEYQDSLMTRLKPRASVIVIQCMVGDTPILMADGTTLPLRDVRPGAEIATYRNGAIGASVVVNWANQGPDSVFEIRTSSGITVVANERHPFLVERNGSEEWVRLRDLRVGDRLIRANPIGVSGEALNAPITIAASQPSARVTACPTTTGFDGPLVTDHHRSILSLGAEPTYGTGTGSALRNTKLCLPSRMESAPSASSPPEPTSARTGAAGFALTMTTKQAGSEGFSATTATLLSDMGRRPKSSDQLLSIYEVTTDEIVAITEAGCEDVFDIQVADTENFIANGLVSHNTRWHQDDLSGGILPENYDGRSGPILCRDGQVWEVLNIPAKCEREDDPVGRKVGEYLWPEWFDARHWANYESNPRTWASLYQQRPQPDTGGQFEKGWFKWYEPEERPESLRVYGASDLAVTKKTMETHPDYSEHGVFGLDDKGDLWVLDWWSGQTAPDVTIDAFLDLVAQWRPVAWFDEAGVIRNAIAPLIERRMRERGVFVTMEYLTSGADKIARVAGFRGRASAGTVHLPRTPWAERLVAQLCAFPYGRYDDAVDVCGNIGRALDQIFDAEPPKPDPEAAPKPFTAAWFAARDKMRSQVPDNDGFYR